MILPPPQARIEIIQCSMQCFVLGFVALVPLVGLPVGVWVLMRYWRVKRRYGFKWNPARRYLHWGCVCASLGAGISSLIALVLGLQ
jgi:ABC-type Fe3+ transport system permease subunit